MAWLLKNISAEVFNLVTDKQAEFTKEKKRKVSIERTVERLLKESYLAKPNK